MANFKRILVAYDGSPHSKTALGWAVLLRNLDDAELDVVKVFDPVVRKLAGGSFDISRLTAEQYAELEKEDRQLLEDARSSCERCSTAKVQATLLLGPVAPTLLDYAGQKCVDLIVAGTQGHGVLSEMVVGSVTATLASLAKVPVLIVKEQPAPVRLQKVLVAYDGSDFAKAALELALALGKSADAQVTAVKVAEFQDLLTLFNVKEGEPLFADKLKALLEGQNIDDKKLLQGAKSAAWFKGMDLSTELLPIGNIPHSILHYAERSNADMIVAGTLGHSLLEGLLAGSVSRKLVSQSKIPVLVVKK